MSNVPKKRPRDTNQLAKRIVDIATGEDEDRKPTPDIARSNASAPKRR